MLIPTTRSGWQLKFTGRSGWQLKFTGIGNPDGQGNRVYHDPGLAEQTARNYRTYLKHGETIEVVPVQEPIELRMQIQAALTVIRQTSGDEFADQLTGILEAYGEEQYGNGQFSERLVHAG